MRFLLILAAAWSIATSAHATDPTPQLLHSAEPYLEALYQQYEQFRQRLQTYATQQGFSQPAEMLATVLHELIHIDSASHEAFNIGGSYYAPYLSLSAWPNLTNHDLMPRLTADDIKRLGPIYNFYMRNAPTNRLANVLDEINAYSQTVPMICANAPDRAPAHLQSLAGHLALVDDYLRVLAEQFPDQYQALAANRVSRGALATIVSNGYRSLNNCYSRRIAAADPRPVPKAATQTFAALP